jgi:hypothetical protein
VDPAVAAGMKSTGLGRAWGPLRTLSMHKFIKHSSYGLSHAEYTLALRLPIVQCSDQDSCCVLNRWYAMKSVFCEYSKGLANGPFMDIPTHRVSRYYRLHGGTVLLSGRVYIPIRPFGNSFRDGGNATRMTRLFFDFT